MKIRKVALLLAVMFGLCWINYSMTLKNAFLMDDTNYIVNNPARFDMEYLQLSFLGFEGKLTAKNHAYFRPVYHVIMSSMYAVFGMNPVGYHVVNIIVFFLAGVTMYFLLLYLFKDPPLAGCAALIFCVHPIQGALVNYANTTAVILITILLNLSFLNIIKAVREGRGVAWRMTVAAVLFLLALFCHEIAVVFPFLLVGLMFFILRLSLLRIVLYTLPSMVSLLVYLYLRGLYVKKIFTLSDTFAFFQIGFGDYIAAFAQLMTWYLSKLVMPTGIVFMWEVLLIREAGHVIFWVVVMVLLVAGVIGLLYMWRDDEPCFLGLLWMVLSMVPVLLACCARMNYGIIFEPHWVPFAHVGFFLLVARLMTGLNESLPHYLVGMGIGMYLIFLLVHSWHYNWTWQKPKRHLTYWLTETPYAYLPNFWLASEYLREGDLDNARIYYLRILDRNYVDADTYANLGVVEHHSGNLDAAMRYYHQAIKRNPKYANAYNNIGVIYRDRGETDKARRYFQKALEILVYHPDARRNLEALAPEQR